MPIRVNLPATFAARIAGVRPPAGRHVGVLGQPDRRRDRRGQRPRLGAHRRRALPQRPRVDPRPAVRGVGVSRSRRVVRPPIGDTVLIKQYLDLGVQNLLVPMVDSAEQAAELVRAVRYPRRRRSRRRRLARPVVALEPGRGLPAERLGDDQPHGADRVGDGGRGRRRDRRGRRRRRALRRAGRPRRLDGPARAAEPPRRRRRRAVVDRGGPRRPASPSASTRSCPTTPSATSRPAHPSSPSAPTWRFWRARPRRSPTASSGRIARTPTRPARATDRSRPGSGAPQADRISFQISRDEDVHDERLHRDEQSHPDTGQDHRRAPQLPVAGGAARSHSGAAELLPQALLVDRGLGRHARTPGRHRAARLRGRDRAHHRRARAARHARATAGGTWHPSPPRTTSACTTCAPPTRARTCARRAATASRRSARRRSRPTASAKTRWRVRTWVNGELVQEDTSATLLFPFGRLVADLSQLMTLETGDVILTGTPAGSSVVVPGDVVEVEVDAPEAPGAPSHRPARHDRHPGHRRVRRLRHEARRSTTCSASRPGAARPSSPRPSPPGAPPPVE